MPDSRKLVVIKLDGDIEQQGFRVFLEIGLEGDRPQTEIIGFLPPDLELVACLEQWQKQYRSLGMLTRIKPKEIIYEGSLSRFESCRQMVNRLRDRLNFWLESESFRPLDKRLREELSRHEPIRILIRTHDSYLHKFPWYLWDFIEHYSQAEIALGAPVFDRPEIIQQKTQPGKVKILAILGHSEGIDVEADRQILNSLPDAEVTFLVEPQRQQLSDRLWEQPWDILFFAGHSETQEDRGRIYLNPQESLTIEELKYALSRAIANGLSIAILNSCDGLGLARQLEQLNLPQIIVMREPVPDRIAQEFLKYFLGAFSSGESFYESERQARERLQGWEHRFPCASLLPTIYQNPAAIPPSWRSLQGKSKVESRKSKVLGQEGLGRQGKSKVVGVARPLDVSQKLKVLGQGRQGGLGGQGDKGTRGQVNKFTFDFRLSTFDFQKGWRELKVAFIISLLGTCLLLGMRSLGILQKWELQAFDRLMQLRAIEPSDRRILVVTIEEADIQDQTKQNMKLRGSLSDEALAQLLRKLAPYRPKAIASDVIHDFPYESDLAALIKQTPEFVAICRINSSQSNLVSISPPPNFPIQQLGFTNFALDPDNVIRRQILGMASDDVCPTDRAFSLRVALDYLGDPSLDLTSDGLWIDKVLFRQLEYDSGGYQLSPKDALGFQILVNYRSSPPQQISLREILNESRSDRLKNLVKDRIILIGVAGEQQDLHLTPYSVDNRQIPGVIVHAQMVSQIISTVKDGRSLLGWWDRWAEIVWIGSWSLVGGILVLWGRSPFYKGVTITIALVALVGSCYIFLVAGFWIPLVPSALGLIVTGAGVTTYLKSDR